MTAAEPRTDAQPGNVPQIGAVSLRELLEGRMNADRERGDDRFADHLAAHVEAYAAHASEHAAIAKAIDLADTIQNQRNANANEWRATLTDNNAKFMTIGAADGLLAAAATARGALSDRLTAIERSREREAGALSTWRFLVVLVGLPGLASFVLWLANAFGPRVA